MSDLTPWRDSGEAVEVAAFGPRIRRAIRAFESRFRGGCRHRDRQQLALVGDLRSACDECAGASATAQTWISTGACSSCGAMLGQPPPLLWIHQSEKTKVLLALRLCTGCSAEELAEVPEGQPEEKP